MLSLADQPFPRRARTGAAGVIASAADFEILSMPTPACYRRRQVTVKAGFVRAFQGVRLKNAACLQGAAHGLPIRADPSGGCSAPTRRTRDLVSVGAKHPPDDCV